MQQLDVLGRDHPLREELHAHEVEQLAPVVGVVEHDREVENLVGLDERQRFEQLVERPEAAREDDEPLGGLHEADLARVEVVEGQADVEVRVLVLLVREVDVEADREAAALLGSAVRGLHHTRAAAGDHGPARLREESPRGARGFVRGMPLVHARRAEERDHGERNLRDGLEAHLELARDLEHARVDVPVDAFEDAAVVHHSVRSMCVKCIATARKTASPMYVTATTPRCQRSTV